MLVNKMHTLYPSADRHKHTKMRDVGRGFAKGMYGNLAVDLLNLNFYHLD